MRQTPTATRPEAALVRAQWQATLFADKPARFDLMRLRPHWTVKPLNIRVHRNHSFELVASATHPWFAFWDREALYSYSDYDDSLTLSSIDGSFADLEVVWLDWARYTGSDHTTDTFAWIEGRLAELRARTSAPILVGIIGVSADGEDRLGEVTRRIPGCRLGRFRSLETDMGTTFWDSRASLFSGTRMSDAACIKVAREFACHWVPSMCTPRLKALAIDLDNTLYSGVLGEDGHGVLLTDGHRSLQEALVAIGRSGVLLSLLSRNEPADVRGLFDARRDFPLRWEHFSAAEIGWCVKSEGLCRIANTLHIGVDAMLLLDDNPGELADVSASIPEVATAYAEPEPGNTLRTLEYYPRLWAWERTNTDELRARDLKAEIDRARFASSAVDKNEYLRSLQVRVRVELGSRSYAARIHELSQKTNQFNLNLMRLTEADVAATFEKADHRIATIALADRMSDSGLIGIVFARREADTLLIYELALSCRSLGRQLEDIFVSEAVRSILLDLPCQQIVFSYRSGSRNRPAMDWLARTSGLALGCDGQVPVAGLLERASSMRQWITIEGKCS